jgi:hypothetical protein
MMAPVGFLVRRPKKTNTYATRMMVFLKCIGQEICEIRVDYFTLIKL